MIKFEKLSESYRPVVELMLCEKSCLNVVCEECPFWDLPTPDGSYCSVSVSFEHNPCDPEWNQKLLPACESYLLELDKEKL